MRSQEIKNRTITLASVLKPVDDTRMYEKMAHSLAADGWQVHIAGWGKPGESPDERIRWHALGAFGRFSLGRLIAPWRILRHIWQTRPAVLVITTHELLWVAALLRTVTSLRIVYDVRENYSRNIENTDAFPKALRKPLAAWVRWKQHRLRHLIDLFVLAEAGYAEQLSFLLPNRTIVAENKAVLPAGFQRQPGGSKNLLFSGTLASSTGVFAAFELTDLLHAADPSVQLHIIGYAAQPHVQRRIRQLAHERPHVRLTGIETPVPHTEIWKAIATASAGLITYPTGPLTEGKIPTKLYEYLAARLPVLLPPHQEWVRLAQTCGNGVVFTSSPDGAQLLDQVTQLQPVAPPSVFWNQEAERLLPRLATLLVHF